MQSWDMFRRRFLCLAALSVLGLVVGCGKHKEGNARLKPLTKDAVILLYVAGICEDGDVFRSSRIDEAISLGMKRSVVSRGQGAEFTESALKRLPSVLEESHAELMVLGYGAMDLWKKTDRAKMKTNLGAMIDLARGRGVQVVLLAMPDLNRLSHKPDPIYQELAGEKGVPVELTIVQSVLSDSSTRTLRYMVNEDGIVKMADAVRLLCVRSGGLQE